MFQEADAARQINRSIGEPLDNKLREYHKLLNEVFTALQEQIRKQDAYAEKRRKRKLNDIPVEPKENSVHWRSSADVYMISIFIYLWILVLMIIPETGTIPEKLKHWRNRKGSSNP